MTTTSDPSSAAGVDALQTATPGLPRVIAVVGLGYVGLPLAVEFGRSIRTIGYDLSAQKITSYSRHVDPAGELSDEQLKAASRLSFTNDPKALRDADFIVIAVPTPVDVARQPDFTPLKASSEIVGRHLKHGAVVVYESTVYPGATEQVCIPILEKYSGMKWKRDFFVGYSPERINPGDKERTVTKIVKVVAGDTDETLDVVAAVYESVIHAGVYRASSIKVAEAAKVIENTQRDLNIALMNELAIIFHRIGIDTVEVLEAAGSKWNFLPFRPGLVGGHCIGVDPFYLTHVAQTLGYHPEVILSGRRINDSMAGYVAQQTVKRINRAGRVERAKVLILGLTFKENCSDLRNSKVADIVAELRDFGCEVVVHDPLAEPADAVHEYDIELVAWSELPAGFDAIVAAVPHSEYLRMPLPELLAPVRAGGVFMDVKSAFDAKAIASAGLSLWRL